MLKDKYS
jgi:hypothetical protein